MEWNSHCTHLTRATYYDSRAIIRVRLRETSISSCTSSTPRSIFCPGLTQSVFFLLCCFSSAAWSVTFDSMLPFLLCCLWGPSHATLRARWCHTDDPQSFTPRARWFHINYLLDLRWEHGWDCREIHVHIIFHSQCDYRYSTNTSVFTVRIHTYMYIHTDTTCVQHVNVGLAQARPN